MVRRRRSLASSRRAGILGEESFLHRNAHTASGPLDYAAGRLDHRVAVSEPAKEFAAQYFPGEYEIIPNGIDCRRFNPDIPPVEGLKDGKLNILFVGRMEGEGEKC